MGKACEFTKRKMKSSKHYYILVLSFLIITNLFSQQTDKVSIKTVGQGKTISDATANALREAISQAYGVFISANTTIVNDSLLKDEIVSLTTGNIEKYDVLSQTEIPTIGYSVILNSVVSLGKLSSFAQSKGAEASFDGGGFAMNIKLQKLNEQAEVIAMNNLLTQTWEYINSAIQFNLQVGQPTLNQNDSTENYLLNIKVIAGLNDTVKTAIMGFLNEGLNQISMSPEEVVSYESVQKPIYTISRFRFRNKASLFSVFVFSYRLNVLYSGFNVSNNQAENIQQNIPANIDFQPLTYTPQFYSTRGFDFYKPTIKYLNDSLTKCLLLNTYDQKYLDSLSNFNSKLSPFNITDLSEFNSLFGKIRKYNYPDYYEIQTLRLKNKNLPIQKIKDHNWEGHFSELDVIYREEYFLLGNLRNVSFDYSLIYTLDDLEKLKDFKVTKLSY
jgi:hypothetical protein